MTAPPIRELADYLRPGPGPCGDPEAGWPALLALADEHRLLPALWSALLARGVRPLPTPLQGSMAPLAVLERAHRENATRAEGLRHQAVRVLDTLAHAGIDAIPIKGSHLLLTRQLPDPAARVAIDVDISVPPVFAIEAQRALVDIGYRPVSSVPGAEPTDHQLAALVADGQVGSVEVHVQLLRGFHRRVLTTDELHDSADEVVVDGIPRRVPSATHAIALLVAHAQLQDDGVRLLRVPLRAATDLAALVDRNRIDVDWREVAACFRRGGGESLLALAGFAATARELFGVRTVEPGRPGALWLWAAEAAAAHARATGLYRDVVSLPRALRDDRMSRLYGADDRRSRARARAVHLLRGAQRRVRGEAAASEPD